ncbi:MAG: PTS transporter subunit EIIC [Oscillospiraceae bacterium]|nr:PTS transporter subunit EIIC [Oscillospiraceae bacterium]
MAKKNYDELAEQVVALVGTAENISYCTHCVTRLRFELKDHSRVNLEELQKVPGVLGTQWSGEQLQVIIGQTVGDVYNAICKQTGLEKQAAVNEQLDDIKPARDWSPKGILNMFLETISSVIAPFIPAIVGCGLTQGLLYSAQMFGWIDATSDTYNFLYTCANTAFYFLPILCAFSAGKRFGCNPYLAATLGAFLIHPTVVGLAGQTVHLFGLIPITFSNYSSSLIPAILCVYFMSWVEKGLKKIVPSMIDIIVTPLLSLVIASVVGFTVLAPLGGFVGNFVANGMMWLYAKFGMVGGAIISAVYPFILATGMQVAFSPFTVINLSTLGYDYIYPMTAASNAAMGACALYVYFKAKNKNVKAMGLSTGITGLIGVTEPVLFGLVLKYKKVLWAVMIGGAVGGAIMGLFTVEYYSFGFVPFGTIMLAFGPTFVYYMAGVIAAMAVSVLALHLMKFED